MVANAPYVVPAVYFPADSVIPVSPSIAAQVGLVDPDIHRRANANILLAATELDETLLRIVVAAPHLHDYLMGLGDVVALAGQMLLPLTKNFSESYNHETSAEAIRATLMEQGSDDALAMLESYVIYDHYFNVIRVQSMTLDEFATQVVAVSRGVLRDLSFAVIEMDEIKAIIHTIRLMFNFLENNLQLSSDDKDGANSISNSVANEPEFTENNLWLTAWREGLSNPSAWTRQVSHYRWLVGHHLFALCAMFCREYLNQASQAVTEEEKCSKYIDAAKSFLRGSSAAMWYAGNFPRETYETYIRPSMVSTKTPEGFSGSQNADYSRMLAVKEKTKDSLFSHYGNDPYSWPRALYVALRQFHEIDIEDTEHHILIAASKVGLDASLSQKTWQENIPDDIPATNAVDILRMMADQKRQDLETRFSNF